MQSKEILVRDTLLSKVQNALKYCMRSTGVKDWSGALIHSVRARCLIDTYCSLVKQGVADKMTLHVWKQLKDYGMTVDIKMVQENNS